MATLLKKWLFRIVGLLVFVLAVLLASENSTLVSLNFLGFQSYEWPVSWWMLLVFVVGVFTGILMNAWTNSRLKWDVRKANKALDKANSGAEVSLSANGSSNSLSTDTSPSQSGAGITGSELEALAVTQTEQSDSEKVGDLSVKGVSNV